MISVEREYKVALLARGTLVEALNVVPNLLTDQGLEKIDLDSLRENLELTYVIRLFAEFETGMLDYWKIGLGKRTKPGASALIDSLSSKHKILAASRIIRKYRNKLVHEEDAQDAPTVNILAARIFLCKYFSSLPPDW